MIHWKFAPPVILGAEEDTKHRHVDHHVQQNSLPRLLARPLIGKYRQTKRLRVPADILENV